MCQVHTGAYVSLLVPGKNDYIACHPRKTVSYIFHVVPNATLRTSDASQLEKRNKEKKKKTRKDKTRQDKTRQDKTRGGKEKGKKVILVDLRN